MMEITNGMLHNHLGMVEGDHLRASLKGPGGKKTSVAAVVTSIKREPRTGTTKTSPHIPLKAMMIAKELEVLAQETPGIGEKEAQTDTNPEESTMKNIAETMGPAQATETTAQVEETMSMKEQDTEMILDPDTQGRVLQMRAGDTLDIIGDGDAKGP